mmetsp:Transcript_3570/g.7335  ORF Transcript_3570/g.7335 Transcript_3570/m.7335 type:complete len:98 (+) Transcript_3570:146-439(+)
MQCVANKRLLYRIAQNFTTTRWFLFSCTSLRHRQKFLENATDSCGFELKFELQFDAMQFDSIGFNSIRFLPAILVLHSRLLSIATRYGASAVGIACC